MEKILSKAIRMAQRITEKFSMFRPFSFNARKTTSLIGFLLFFFTANATYNELNVPNGVISVMGSDYTDYRNDVWYINCGTNQTITFNYFVSLENSYDYVQIYSIDSNGNESTSPIATLTGNMGNGVVTTDIPSGRAKVIFHSDDSGSYTSGYQGFAMYFAPNAPPPLNPGYINIATSYVLPGVSPGTFYTSSPAAGGSCDTYNYLWQQSTDGLNWSTCSGDPGAENYTVPALNATTYFHRVVFCNSSYDVTNTVCITVDVITPFNPPTDKTYKKPDGSFTTDPTQGVMVGSIPGSASVTPTGAATYQIPIDVPGGINGMQPQVSVVYNSQGGFGALGTGWDISGSSAITRGVKNKYFDGLNDNIKLDDSDALYLDGQRLIKLGSGDAFSNGTVYATELENFARVTVTNNGSGGIYFMLVTKDGKTMEYGHTSDSQLRNSNNSSDPVVMAWKLNKVTDLYANYMTYTYTEYGQYLQRIDYTGNGSVAPVKSVVFSYDVTLSKPKASFVKSFKITQNKVLSSICTYSGSTKVSDYRFGYVDSGIDKHLDNVTRYASDNSRLKSTKINWGTESSLQQVEVGDVTDAGLSGQPAGAASITYADMNGDGYPDRIEMWVGSSSESGHIFVYLFDKVTKKFASSNSGTTYFDYHDYQIYKPKLIASDINNDGRLELILTNWGKIYVYSYINGMITLTNGSGYDTETDLGTYNQNDSYELISLDVNHDNYNDVILIFKGHNDSGAQQLPRYMICYGGTSGLCSNSTSSSVNYNSFYNKQIGDFNADGKIDVMGLTSSSNDNSQTSTGREVNHYIAGSNNYSQALGDLNYFSSGRWGQYFSNYVNLQTIDFNGDGLSDILGQSSSTHYWSILLNNGGSDATPTQLNFDNIIQNSWNINADERSQMCPIDYNGDGLPDLILGDETYSGSSFSYTTWYFYRNTGGNFVLDQTIISYNRMPQLSAGLVDINNDGVADLVIPVLSKFKAFTMPNANRRNLVSSITDGMDLTNSFVYKNYDNYSQETTTNPLRNLNAPITVVEKHTDITGSETTYDFQGAKIHTDGKGFLGFGTVTISNQQKNVKSVSHYEINSQYYGVSLLDQTVTNYGGTTTISTASQTNGTKNVDTALKRYIPIVSAQTSTDALKNLTNSSSALYDDYGNPTHQETNTGNDNDKITTIVDTQYKTSGTGIARYLPEAVTVTKQKAGEQDYVRTTNYEYNGNRSLTKEIEDPTKVNQLTTEYKNFDSWGHAQTVEVSITNKPVRSSLVEYTPSGYYVKSKTNILGQKTSYNWDETKGLLLNETEELALGNRTTTHAYDAWGQEYLTTYPDGTQKGSTVQWANGLVTGAQYYTYSQTSGSSPVWIWYDANGREVRKDYFGIGSRKILVSTSYFVSNTANNGLVSTVSQPYFETEGNTMTPAASYTYDEFGRPLTVTTPINTTTTTYNYRTTTVSNPEKTVVTTLNSAGQTMTSSVNGKPVNYTYYPSGLTKTSTPDGGQSITIVYDLQGNRVKLNDPDGGFVRSEYNGFAELIKEVQRVHLSGDSITTVNTYENDGRLKRVDRNAEQTNYGYDANKRVSTIEITGQHKQTFTYDSGNKTDRITNVKEEFGGREFNTGKQYDSNGRIYKETYPSGYYITNTYDPCNGSLTEVKDPNNNPIWKVNIENARGQLTSVTQGTKTTIYGFDDRGMPISIYADGVVHMEYQFSNKGNLNYRIDNLTSQREDFGYDAQNRLTNWDVTRNGQTTYNSMGFDGNGNINSKSDIGYTLNYGGKNPNGSTTGRPDPPVYSAIGPHALSTIAGVPGSFSSADLAATYTNFKKIATLSEGGKTYAITYGVDDQRRVSVQTISGVTTTRYYVGDYEEVITGSIIKKIHYLSGAIFIQETNQPDKFYYSYADYQGSLLALTDANGNVAERYAYDPWGVRRNPDNWTQSDSRTAWMVNRGYTGHEHLDAFGIINMNGRVYDPYTAQFFSPDPYVQAPGDWLNYNRYGYCMGNPFKYSDPSGDLQIGPFYISLNIGWSPNGGLSFGISAGVGIENIASVGVSIGFGAKYGNFSFSVNGSLGGAYAYAGFDTKSGFMAGAGYAPASIFSGLSPINISTNMMSAGVDYSQSGGFYANAGGFGYGSGGFSFNPSLGASVTFKYGAEYLMGNDDIKLDPNDKSGKPDIAYGNNSEINEQADKWFKRPSNLTTIHADGTGGVGGKINGKYVYGVTRYSGLKSTVYLAQGAYKSRAFLFLILQHEYVHVNLNGQGFGSEDYTYAQEVAAYTVSYSQAIKWGMYKYASWFNENKNYFNDLNIHNFAYPAQFNHFDLKRSLRLIIPQ